MRKRNRLATAISGALALLMLSACGGGGGGGGSDFLPPPPMGASPAPSPAPVDSGRPVVRQTVQGTIEFETYAAKPGGALDYATVLRKPSRMVAIELVDAAGHTVATGTTDGLGRYSMAAPVNTVVLLRIFASSHRTTGTSGQWQIDVVDNTLKDALLGAVSPPFLVSPELKPVNILLPSGWKRDPSMAGLPSPGDRVAAPFAILDTLYEAQSKLLGSRPGIVFPPLTVQWSALNRAAAGAPGDPASGAIQGTGFNMVNAAAVIQVTGAPDADPDEYDSSVIAHEWAHYMQHAFSRDDSVGGRHSQGDSLDVNVAFSEGLATAYSGIALGRSHYTDSYGPKQPAAWNIDIDLAAAPSRNAGWFNEDSVRYVIWKLHEAVLFEPIFAALSGPFRTVMASTGIHSFASALASVSPSSVARLRPLLESQSISPTADAWGIGETNAGGSTVALPMVRSLVLETPATGVCVSGEFDPSGDHNKLGEIAYLRLSLPESGRYGVRVSGPGTSDPDLRLSGTAGFVLTSSTAKAGLEELQSELPAGDYLLAIDEYRLSSTPTCFTVNVSKL